MKLEVQIPVYGSRGSQKREFPSSALTSVPLLPFFLSSSKTFRQFVPLSYKVELNPRQPNTLFDPHTLLTFTMFSKAALISAVLAAVHVSAFTTPSFQGKLLIQGKFVSFASVLPTCFITLFRIVGANTRKCLQAANSNGAPVVVAVRKQPFQLCYSCNNFSALPFFSFRRAPAVPPKNGSLALEVPSRSTATPSAWICKLQFFSKNHRHPFPKSGYPELLPLHRTNGKNADGTKIQVWDCGTNNPNQQFDYTKYGDNQ